MRNRLLWLVAGALLSLSIAVAAIAQCQLAFNEPPQSTTEVRDLVDMDLLAAIDLDQAELSDVPAHSPELYLRLAWESYQAGDYELAARAYLFLTQIDRDPTILYNLACCYSLMGSTEQAAKYLGYAVQYGYTDADFALQDPDFAAVRETAGFQAAIGEMRAAAMASMDEQRGEDMYVGFPLLMKCRTVRPADYQPDKTYPLVIGLHGAGDTPERFARLSEYFESQDFIYAAPQAPYCLGRQRGFLWFGEISAEDEGAAAEARELNCAYVLHIIDRLKTEYNIGSVYLVGFSQGAEMAYLTGLSHPEIIDGIVVFGGRLMPEWLADGAITQAAHTAPAHGSHDGLRVFIAHGDEDVPERAYSARDTLMAAGFDVEYREFHGGHFIHLDTLHEAEHWMKQDLATTTASKPGGALAGTAAAADKPGGATVSAASTGTARGGTSDDSANSVTPSPPTS